MSTKTVKEAKISDLISDNLNANKHTEFGLSLVEKSLQSHGAGRSILLDKFNNIIAGNGLIESAGNVGMEDILIVETTGNQIVAVKRMDIDLNSKRGREMAIADNASAKASITWDETNLLAIHNEFDINLGSWGLGEFMPEDEPVSGGGEKQYSAKLIIEIDSKEKADELYSEFLGRGYNPFLKED